jgi:hypothetical protein
MLVRVSIRVRDDGIRHRRAERNGRKVRLRVVAIGPRHQLNDFAHENSSDTAMTTRPMSASDIRQAVIGVSPKEKMCGMVAVRAQTIWARTLSRWGPRAAAVTIRAASRRVRACRPVAYGDGRLGRRHAHDAQATGVGRCGVVLGSRRPIGEFRREDFNKKTRDGSLRAGLTIFAMVILCQ